MKKKYVLNTKTKCLHIVDKCHFSNVYKDVAEYFDEYDKVVAKHTRQFHNCKFCFKGE